MNATRYVVSAGNGRFLGRFSALGPLSRAKLYQRRSDAVNYARPRFWIKQPLTVISVTITVYDYENDAC